MLPLLALWQRTAVTGLIAINMKMLNVRIDVLSSFSKVTDSKDFLTLREIDSTVKNAL